MLCAIRRIAIAVFPKPKLLRWLAIVRSPNIFSVLFVLIACIGIIYSNSNVLFVDFTMPKGDMASNDILIVEAKHFRLFHGHYSLFSFYHPGPIYFQWMALFEWLFVDVFRVFISPQAAHYFSIIVLHVVAFALYLRLWLLWSGSMTISIAALIVTNAVPFTIIGRNYVVSTWPADFYLASSLIVVTGLIGIATRGPSWLPLLVFGLAQLVHGHASFIGLVPIMIVTAATVAWMGGRLPDQIYRVDNAIAYVKSHPLPFIISAAIAVLFALPMIINTIWAWPGEFPKYFRFPLRNNSFIAAINYVISFMPMNGLWTLLFLLPPRKFTNASLAATDYHFVGLLILATAGVPALFYAYRGVYDFGASYLLYWILPFIGAALATAILYFASVFSFGWLRFGLVTLSAVWSLKGYRAWTVLYHDTRSPALTAAAVEMLSSRAVSGEKIVLQLERGVAGWRMVWWETVSIFGAMNRSNAHFLCVAPSSWHLVFHEQYRCRASDKVSQMVYVVAKGKIHGDRLAELTEAEIMPTRPPSVGTQVEATNLGGAAVAFLGEWSADDQTGTVWSNSRKASLSFNTSLLPPRFAILLQARLFPSTQPPEQNVRITDEQGRELAMLTNNVLQDLANVRIELARRFSGNMMTITFEVSRPVAPHDIGVNEDRRSLGIGIQRVTFADVTTK